MILHRHNEKLESTQNSYLHTCSSLLALSKLSSEQGGSRDGHGRGVGEHRHVSVRANHKCIQAKLDPDTSGYYYLPVCC